MIAKIAVCPQPPLLLPEYTGRVDAGAGLRQRCIEAVRSLLAGGRHQPPRRLLLLTASDRDPGHTGPALGERIGRHLLDLAGAELPVEPVEVPWDIAPADAVRIGRSLDVPREASGLLVMADGSARRGERAPGHLDERSFAVDERVVTGVRRPDPEALAGLDAGLCADLLVHGRAPLQVLAGVLARTGRFTARSLHVEDPLGVLYLVALLDLESPDESTDSAPELHPPFA